MSPFSASLAALLETPHTFPKIAALCDQHELEMGGLVAEPPWPYAVHLLSHVLLGQLELARLLWKRIPDSAKEGSAELSAVWALIAALWRRDYAAVGTALASQGFSVDAQRLVAACGEAHRKATLELLSVAYTTISLADAAQALALSEVLALQAVQSVGWTLLDGEGGWLAVAPPAAPAECATDAVSLADLVAFAGSRSG